MVREMMKHLVPHSVVLEPQLLQARQLPQLRSHDRAALVIQANRLKPEFGQSGQPTEPHRTPPDPLITQRVPAEPKHRQLRQLPLSLG